MHWQKLPVEIQLIIFQYLNQSQVQLNQCQLTCRGWRATAHRELYSNVNVKRSKLDVFAQSVSDESASHGDYVNTIRFYEFGREELKDNDAAYLSMISKYCPNVERVMVDPTEVVLFRDALNQIGLAGLWKRIKELPQDHIELLDECPAYSQIVPLFTKSLEIIDFCMTVYDKSKSLSTTKRLIPQRFDFMADYLHYFQHITKVSVRLDRSHINLQLLNDFFDHVPPTVKSFKISCIINSDYSLEEEKEISTMSPLKPSNHLTSLQATLPILNADTIGYALDKFPRISSLILVRAERRFARNIRLSDIPKTLLNQIMEVDTFELKNLNLSNYMPIFDTLLKEGTAVKELTLSRYSGEFQGQFMFQVDIKKYMKDGAIVTSICARSNQSRYQINRVSPHKSIEMFHEIKLLEEYGAYLKKLIIHNLITYGYELNELCMLNSLAGKCPNLKTLVFTGLDLECLDSTTKTREELPLGKNCSVKTLVLRQQRISESSIKMLSQQLPSLSKLVMMVETNQPRYLLRDSYEFDQYLTRKKEIWIDMPYSQLDSIHLQYKMDLEVHQNRLFFIRLQEDNKIRFFYCLEKFTPRTKTLFNECTKKVLGDCLSKAWYRKVAYCSIKCASLKKLIVDSNNYQRSYFF